MMKTTGRIRARSIQCTGENSNSYRRNVARIIAAAQMARSTNRIAAKRHGPRKKNRRFVQGELPAGRTHEE